jgi:ABC-type cobalamin/Fe3+-siderophores transport system ATPase subunit
VYIEYIQVKNFGRLQDVRHDYVNGLVVVRGGNGSGKTTLTAQAPLYVFFGSSTLDAPIADTVAEGAKLNGMSVELKYGPYVVKRSKGSASVVGNGVEISGQAEVSNFWYDYFGISKGAEESVLLAKQGETAGILNGKAGEVTSIIEDLAGFYQIDELVEKVKVKFPSGNKALLTENLETAQEKLEVLGEVELPDLKELRLSEESCATQLEQEKVFCSAAEQIKVKADEALKAATAHNHKVELAENKLTNIRKEIEDATVLTKVTKERKYPKFDFKEIEAAEELLATVDERREAWAAYSWLQSLEEQKLEWEGTLESFELALQGTAARVKLLTKEAAEFETEARLKKASIVNDKNCSLCGQDISHIHEDMNRRLTIEHQSLLEALEGKKAELEKEKATLADLNSINNEQIRRVKKAKLKYMEVIPGIVPFNFQWLGKIPIQPVEGEIVAASNLLSEFKTTEKSLARDNHEIVRLEKVISVKQVEEATIAASMEKKLDTKPLNESFIQAVDNLNKASVQKEAAQERLNSAEKAVLSAEHEIKSHEKEVLTTKEEIKTIKTKLKADSRNGKILKSVREARVKVLDLVWDNIVKLVSHKASEMLGREMKMEKVPKGFTINGRHSSRLSGAEASSVGIALREVIRNTFAGGCGFCILDEPLASMDNEVSLATIGAISSMQGQVFVITHEDSSEIFADQVVELCR